MIQLTDLIALISEKKAKLSENYDLGLELEINFLEKQYENGYYDDNRTIYKGE